MKIALRDEILEISEIPELSAKNCQLFREEIHAAMPPSLEAIEIDLSQTLSVDSYGLGALIAVQKAAADRNGDGNVAVRLLDPPPAIQQLLELTRLHRTFEIVKRSN